MTEGNLRQRKNVTATDASSFPNGQDGDAFTVSSTSTPGSASSKSSLPADHPSVLSDKWCHRTPDHQWEEKKFDCPCPAMATLANHSYITPKSADEKVAFYKWIPAIMQCYNVTRANATFLTFMATILCGNVWAVSLRDLGKHGRVEHDASITRHDFHTGKDYRNASKSRIDSFLASSQRPNWVTLQDYAIRRCQVESEMQRPTTWRERLFRLWWTPFLGYGEVALTMRIFGGDKKHDPKDGAMIRKDWLHEWLTYERLPKDWNRPAEPFGINKTFDVAKDLKARMAELRKGNAQLAACSNPARTDSTAP